MGRIVREIIGSSGGWPVREIRIFLPCKHGGTVRLMDPDNKTIFCADGLQRGDGLQSIESENGKGQEVHQTSIQMGRCFSVFDLGKGLFSLEDFPLKSRTGCERDPRLTRAYKPDLCWEIRNSKRAIDSCETGERGREGGQRWVFPLVF